MQSVFMLKVDMLIVIMPSAVVLNVMAQNVPLGKNTFLIKPECNR
jgi:hypothetical protein